MANSQTLGRYYPSRMWWADIEVPNRVVDVNSWTRSACYPQGSFYPLSDGPSTRNRRITKPDFRPCSTCKSRSQAPLCLCTRNMISNHTEGTFGRLRYSLGGDRPSQTTHLTLSSTPCRAWVRIIIIQEWYPKVDSIAADATTSSSPTYPVHELQLLNIKL